MPVPVPTDVPAEDGELTIEAPPPVETPPPPSEEVDVPAPAPPAPEVVLPVPAPVAAAQPVARPRAGRSERVRPRAPSRRARALQQEPNDERTQPDPVFCVLEGPDGHCLIFSTDCDPLGTDGNDELIGTPEADVICGLGGMDHLMGGEGEDTLIGGQGNDDLDGGDQADCEVNGDAVTEEDLSPCEEVGSYQEAALAAPTGGVVTETNTAAQVYIALTRYVQAGIDETGALVEAIAVILKTAINYDDGSIKFIVRCSYAGAGRVTLTSIVSHHRKVRLGVARFSCSGEGDDPLVSVSLSARGRGLVERSKNLRIRATVVDPAAAKQPEDARQTFVLQP